MADNIQLNTNSTVGSTIKTDDLSGAHVQYVKLMDGTDGGTTVIAGGTTGLAVNVTSVGTADANVDTDPVDRAARDCGKIDIAAFDVGLPAGTAWMGYVGLATTSTLPAGTNAIGKLAANSGVDIGDVDILSIAAGDNNIGNVDLASAIPAGTAFMGYVGIQTVGTIGTVTGITNALPAGTNFLGYVRLDTTGSLPAGTNGIGKLTANTGVDIGDVDVTSIAAGDNNIGNVDLASAIPAGTNFMGYVGIQTVGTIGTVTTITNAVPVTDNSGSLTVDAPVGTPVFVTPTPSTTGGWSPRFIPTLLTTSVGVVKDSAGTLGGWYVYNPAGVVSYIQFFNTNVVTLGTTVPVMSIGIPSTGAANVEFTNGIQFTSVIRVFATTLSSNNGIPTSGPDCTFFFK